MCVNKIPMERRGANIWEILQTSFMDGPFGTSYKPLIPPIFIPSCNESASNQFGSDGVSLRRTKFSVPRLRGERGDQ